MINNSAVSVEDDRLYSQLGVRFDRRTLPEVIALALADVQSPVFYVTCNLNHLRVLQSEPEFREAYRRAALITLDSRPIQVASRLRFGAHLPLVTGADLFAVLFERLRPGKDRPFFIPSSDETGEQLSRALIARGFTPSATAYHSPPFGFERDADRSKRMVAQIQAHRATHLFMGVGAPKSERWVAQHLDVLPPAHILCVGAALDFIAGAKTRAPAWLGQFGLEWLHRLLSEPSRLLPRYAGDAAVLAKVLAGQKLARVSLPHGAVVPDRHEAG
jgi:N-acetylglucosaminyldiphosphoundecaprenol N-acetyl-beta-D-mannosaminyltransferase